MLDHLFQKIDGSYGEDAFFMGLAFKFEKGIAIIDKHFDEEIADGFILEWVSFMEMAHPISVVCKDTDELFLILKEVAL
ncbi:hypothetical protein GRF59_05620 [Paenibacillus sp. HJL G12]|uniref:Uncharacterized protein n=1 Tax=Paenibacillus dendrobii TaxID=2691084 RepID=A0A7X3LH22_9BACL|nr:hypothetical protein [Paenibacillus dendrobii]MWV43103.1 hypothetical protein [Paenibacillus dendrobii]